MGRVALRRAPYLFGLVAAFCLGMVVNAAAATDRPDLTIFWKAWDLAEANFVYRDALDQQKMLYGAIRGMVDALGDDGHSRFLTPDDVKMERSSLTGRFDGIGAEVNLRNGHPIVVAPIEDSPAEKAGLLPGDTILSVDGQDVSAASLSEIVGKVRGPRGTVVRLGVVHPGQSSPVDVSIVRGPITVKSVTWALVPGTSFAHVRINRFAAATRGHRGSFSTCGTTRAVC
jgi:carboxyl-terminal processing protease